MILSTDELKACGTTLLTPRFQPVNPKLQPLSSMRGDKREDLWVKVTNEIYELLKG